MYVNKKFNAYCKNINNMLTNCKMFTLLEDIQCGYFNLKTVL